MEKNPLRYAWAVIATGTILATAAWAQWRVVEPGNYLACLGLAILAATWKIRFPGLEGVVAPSFVFILVSVARFDWPQSVALAMAQVVVQYYWGRKAAPRLVQLAFNVASLGLAAFVAHQIAHLVPGPRVAWVGVAAVAMLVVNALVVSVIVCLTQKQPLGIVWRGVQALAVPYWLAGGILAALWAESDLAALPVVVMASISVYLLDACFRPWMARQRTIQSEAG